MTAQDLTTLANVKSWLGISTDTDNALLSRLITAASSIMQNYVNRDFVSQSYTTICDGIGGNTMVLPNYPITEVQVVKVDGLTIPSTSYIFDWHRLILRGYTFTRDKANVEIHYTAGYTTIPADLEEACIELVGYKYRERNRIGEASKAMAGETTSYNIRDLPETVRTILNQYKRVVPV